MEDLALKLIGTAVILLINTWVVWLLWPAVMVAVFHLPEITFGQTLSLLIITGTLFKSTNISSNK